MTSDKKPCAPKPKATPAIPAPASKLEIGTPIIERIQ